VRCHVAFAAIPVQSPDVQMPVISDLTAFAALTVLGAAWLVLQLSLAWFVVRRASVKPLLRSLGWLPPLTPYVAFIGGARVRSLCWCIVAALYLVLRTRA
jgi:hypothetical protein